MAEAKVQNQPQSGRFGLTCYAFLVIPFVTIGVGVWLHFLPSILTPVPIHLPPLPELTGVLAENSRLTDAVRLFEGQVEGPESIAFLNGQF